jgi:hypothetical protein
MATRNRKNGCLSKTTRRRRSKPKTNLTNIAVSALVANSITQGAFNANLIDFFTGKMDGVYKAGSDGSWRMTLPELLGVAGRQGFGGTYGAGIDFQSALMKNLKANWVQMAAGVILIPVVAKTATKLIRKPVILPANRMLKSVGLDVKV